MYEIEKEIIDMLGYHVKMAKIGNYVLLLILNSNNDTMGSLYYDEITGYYNLRINAPEIWLDTKRHKDSKEIQCEYSIGKTKGKARILKQD